MGVSNLFRAGGSVNEPRPGDGHTPLYLAASQGRLECCRVLIQHGAETGTRMKSSIEGYWKCFVAFSILWNFFFSLTALDIALQQDHAGCVSYLMSCHAPSGGGAYHRAAATIQAVWRYHRYKVCSCVQ